MMQGSLVLPFGLGFNPLGNLLITFVMEGFFFPDVSVVLKQ